MTTTTATTHSITAIPGLDLAARILGSLASHVTPVQGAGVFWISGGPAFIEAWREPGAWTLRVGRVELVLDR